MPITRANLINTTSSVLQALLTVHPVIEVEITRDIYHINQHGGMGDIRSVMGWLWIAWGVPGSCV